MQGFLRGRRLEEEEEEDLQKNPYFSQNLTKYFMRMYLAQKKKSQRIQWNLNTMKKKKEIENRLCTELKIIKDSFELWNLILV